METIAIEKTVTELVKEITFKTVDPDKQLIKEGIIDSISIVDLSVALEEAFSIKIPFVDLNEQHFASVNSITQYIQLKK